MFNLKRLIAVAVLLNGLSLAVTASVQSQSQTQTSPRGNKQFSHRAARNEPLVQSSETDELLQSAFALYRQRKFDEALANCVKAAALSPKDHRPHVLSAILYMGQMKYRSASAEVDKAIELLPGDKRLYLMKAEVAGKRGEKDEAIAAARKALALDPNFAEAYVMIGEALKWDEKRRAEAIAAYQSAIKINPSLLFTYDPLGQLLDLAKDQKGAEEVYRRGMAADPKHMTGRFALGRLLVKEGRLVEAREVWDGRTSDEDRTFPQFIELLKRAENLKRVKDALAQKPHDPEALLEMGLAVMEGDSWVVDGRQKRAIVYFKEALAVKPDYARAQYAICKAYIQIANIFKDENKTLDQEMAKIRRMDSALAAELEEYRKKYAGGIIGTPIKTDQ